LAGVGGDPDRRSGDVLGVMRTIVPPTALVIAVFFSIGGCFPTCRINAD